VAGGVFFDERANATRCGSPYRLLDDLGDAFR
jgi:hypothetical protein